MLANPLHELFVVEYLNGAHFNGAEAYRRVYRVSGASAWVGASRLRKRPDVAAEIDRRFQLQLKALEEPARELARDMVGSIFGGRRR